MHVAQAPAPAKDNLVGICAAIGGDFGFDPDYLRVVLAVSLLWKPEVTLAVYVALGVLVLLSRVIVPNRRRTPTRPVLIATSAAPLAAAPAAPEYAQAA